VSGPAGLRRFVPGAPEEAPATQPGQAAPVASTAQSAEAARPGPEEACEFCATAIPAEHGHVADLDTSTLMCACRACYLLFTHSGAGQGWQAAAGDRAGQGKEAGQAGPDGPQEAAGLGPQAGSGQGAGPQRRIGRARYRSVPDRYRSDPGHRLTLAEWNALEIPVGLAFFLRSSASGDTTAFYPSPAGATECRLDLEAWARIAADHPLVAAAAPDVEAILISRGPRDQDGVEEFLVPVDACYELAGRMRLLWRGFDGGAEARQSIAEFLDRVRERSRDLSQER
jgi:hypothetical protein